MSDEAAIRKALAILLICLLAPVAPVAAADTESLRIGDPLLARPPDLITGRLLPGDDQRVECAASPYVAGKALSLADAIDQALCQQPQIQAAWAAIKLQAAQLGEARAGYLPTVTSGASKLNSATQYEGGSGRRSLTTLYATLTWRLLDFGGRSANQRAADAMLQSALASHDAAVQKALASVVASYYEVQSSSASQQAREKSQQLARQLLETAIRREQRGVGSLPETLQARTFLAKAELEQARASGQHKKAQAMLAAAMGLLREAQDVPVLTLVPEQEEYPDGLEQNLPAWLQAARQYHPAILAARAQLEAAREKLQVARSEGMPTLDLSASQYANGRPNQAGNRGDRERMVGLNLTVPIFEGFARDYKVGGAQAQIEAREAELQEVQTQVLGDIASTYAEAMTALNSLSSSRRLLEAAQGAVDSVRRKYDAGAADIVEMLNAQTALSEADQERVKAMSDWRSARLRLLANAGRMGRWAVAGNAR
ncbi:TolC family protein [Herbaspirillum seropedicae]|uniref:TolC family protein n=1 Tax=Herbaspirillum seropedicae TaxID=964 RepID=UPI000847EC5A|nr:TolC family protein [Herbaspirillum seropedicae]AON55121.1 outer membrane channel lipoprotein [Herbaspirillum seropedicae]